jgi:hypothetical protein
MQYQCNASKEIEKMKKLVALPAGLVILAAGLLGSAGTASASTPTHLGRGVIFVKRHPRPEYDYHYIHRADTADKSTEWGYGGWLDPAAVHHHHVYDHENFTPYTGHPHYTHH